MILFEDDNVRVAALRGRVVIHDKLDGMDRIADDDEAERYWDHWTRHGGTHGTAKEETAATRDDDGA